MKRSPNISSLNAFIVFQTFSENTLQVLKGISIVDTPGILSGEKQRTGGNGGGAGVDISCAERCTPGEEGCVFLEQKYTLPGGVGCISCEKYTPVGGVYISCAEICTPGRVVYWWCAFARFSTICCLNATIQLTFAESRCLSRVQSFFSTLNWSPSVLSSVQCLEFTDNGWGDLWHHIFWSNLSRACYLFCCCHA